jgi:hypothetical protein
MFILRFLSRLHNIPEIFYRKGSLQSYSVEKVHYNVSMISEKMLQFSPLWYQYTICFLSIKFVSNSRILYHVVLFYVLSKLVIPLILGTDQWDLSSVKVESLYLQMFYMSRIYFSWLLLSFQARQNMPAFSSREAILFVLGNRFNDDIIFLGWTSLTFFGTPIVYLFEKLLIIHDICSSRTSQK